MADTDGGLKPEAHARWQAALLACVAGYSDTIGFLSYGAFAGLMSGNTVMLGIALAHGATADAVHTAFIVAAFLCGVGTSALLHRRGVTLRWLIGIEAALLVSAAWLAPASAAPMLAFAMGVQNAAATHFRGAVLNTVFITGDLQKLVQAVVRFDIAEEHAVIGAVVALWCGYLTGVVAAAIARSLLSMPLLLAAAVLPATLLRRR